MLCAGTQVLFYRKRVAQRIPGDFSLNRTYSPTREDHYHGRSHDGAHEPLVSSMNWHRKSHPD